MSFILEALKKSESERQRQSGPALFEVKVAPPRPRFPVWAAVIAALLLVNLAAVAWVLLRNSSTSAAPPQASPMTAQQSPPAQAPAQADAGVAAPVAHESAVAGVQAPGTPAAVPPAYPPGETSAGSNASSTGAPGTLLAAPSGGQHPGAAAGAQHPSTPASQPWVASQQQAAPDRQDAQQAYGEPPEPGLNPDDYALARPAPQRSESYVIRGTHNGLPTYEEVAARSGTRLPELRLELHSYAPQASGRFVFINAQRLREGDSLPEGVRVDDITPEGATLSYRGTRFVLMRD